MGIFGTIGNAIKGGVGGFLKGGPVGALTGAASGAIGSLLGGGGAGGALRGGLVGGFGGAAGQQAGMSPAAIAALSALANAQLSERGQQREGAEAAFNARQDLLTRNLGLAERSFADKAPLRNFGMNSLGRFAQGGFGRGIFNTPGEMGQETGSLTGASPFAGNSLFGGAGAFGAPMPSKPSPVPDNTREGIGQISPRSGARLSPVGLLSDTGASPKSTGRRDFNTETAAKQKKAMDQILKKRRRTGDAPAATGRIPDEPAAPFIQQMQRGF